MLEITKEYNFQVQLFAAIVILKYHQIQSSKTSWLAVASSWGLMSHLLQWSHLRMNTIYITHFRTTSGEQALFISHILESHQVNKHFLYHT